MYDHGIFYFIILSVVSTTLTRFFRGCPPGKLSSVFLPIATTFPFVVSDGKISYPAEYSPVIYFLFQLPSSNLLLRSNSYLSSYLLYLYRYLEYFFNLVMCLIIDQFYIISCKLIKSLISGFNQNFGAGSGSRLISSSIIGTCLS